MPREQISQEGRFIDREHTDIYVCITNLQTSQYTLQASEVEQVNYVDLDEFISIQQNEKKCNELSYVPINGFDKYYKNVFTVLKQLKQYIQHKV